MNISDLNRPAKQQSRRTRGAASPQATWIHRVPRRRTCYRIARRTDGDGKEGFSLKAAWSGRHDEST